MIRTILTISFMVNFSITFGQVSHKLVNIVGSSKDSTIQVLFEQVDTERRLLLIFENNSSKDTIDFSKTDNKFHSNSCKIEQIQIDGKGLKEIHIRWSYNNPFGFVGYIGGQTSWGNQKNIDYHEVWNLDTKERLFSAVSYYSIESYTTVGRDTKFTYSFWSYDFSISEDGSVTISNIKKTQDQTPDNSEGKYSFVRGKYYKE